MTFVNAHKAKTLPYFPSAPYLTYIHTATHHDYYFHHQQHHHYALCQCQRDLLSVCLSVCPQLRLRLSTAAIASFLSKHLPAISLALVECVYYFWQCTCWLRRCQQLVLAKRADSSHMSLSPCCTHCLTVSQRALQAVFPLPFPFPELIEAHNTN